MLDARKYFGNDRFRLRGGCCRLGKGSPQQRGILTNPMPTPDKPKNDRKTALRELLQAETMMQIALVLPLSCIVGWALGDFLDHKLHQSWIAMLGLALGVAAGFIQVIRMANHANRTGEKNDR
jgi:F0F1-type ATP synthase assembly protein I